LPRGFSFKIPRKGYVSMRESCIIPNVGLVEGHNYCPTLR
jgi:hypothetical protein